MKLIGSGQKCVSFGSLVFVLSVVSSPQLFEEIVNCQFPMEVTFLWPSQLQLFKYECCWLRAYLWTLFLVGQTVAGFQAACSRQCISSDREQVEYVKQFRLKFFGQVALKFWRLRQSRVNVNVPYHILHELRHLKYNSVETLAFLVTYLAEF